MPIGVSRVRIGWVRPVPGIGRWSLAVRISEAISEGEVLISVGVDHPLTLMEFVMVGPAQQHQVLQRCRATIAVENDMVGL